MNTDLDFSSSNKTLHCTFIGLFVVETFSVSLDGAEGQNNINEDIKEFRESEARRNNIIILNVNESKSTEAEARKQEDTSAPSLAFPDKFSSINSFTFGTSAFLLTSCSSASSLFSYLL
jgi:hypothetical protein